METLEELERPKEELEKRKLLDNIEEIKFNVKVIKGFVIIFGIAIILLLILSRL